MKKSKVTAQFLEELRNIPIVQVACEKTGISRNSVYRWRRSDKKFAKEMDDHLIVITSFRGKNAFGGTVLNTVKARVGLDGEVIEIIEQF